MFSLAWLIAIVIFGLAFDFLNGFNDTANAIATSVSTKALSPRMAIIIAASLNFFGALSGTAVAATIGKGIIKPEVVTPVVLIAALIGAITWNLTSWHFGIPSSSSHALIGGLVGAALAGFGPSHVSWTGFMNIFSGLLATPVIALFVGATMMFILFWIFKKASPAKTNRQFRRLQIITACMAAFAHGSNDAQKTMGIITMSLVSAGILTTFDVPFWVMLACALAMSAGTALGGWRIIRTMGGKIFRIEPINGFAADLSSALVIYTSSHIGIPVSTTHVVSSSIMGVGAAKRLKGVRWNIAKQIVTAWVVTIPSAALVSSVFYILLSSIFK